MRQPWKRSAIEWAKFAGGLRFRQHVAELESLTRSQFLEYQSRHLEDRYRDAKRRVPYYAASNAYPDRLPDSSLYDQLATLPVFNKSTVKEKSHLFLRTPIPRFSATHTTGGTTGTPLTVRAGAHERGLTNAILEQRNLNVSGFRYPRTVRLSGFLSGDAYWLRVPATRVGYLSIYHLSPRCKADVVRTLRAFRPQLLHGYASALAQLANLCSADELGLEDIAVVTTSETMSETDRALIEDRLRARVFNEYGSQEGQHLALECSARAMHVHPARGVVEVLQFDSDHPAAKGELGRIVVSGINSVAMPLFRYDIGDAAISTGHGPPECPCGSQWPTIGTVHGRSEDLVRTPDGRRIGLLSHSTLKDVTGVVLSQIRQRSYNEFDYLLIVNSEYRSAVAERHITDELRNRLGYPCQVLFQYVSDIPRTSAGKIQAVVVDF
jgi:phenylacetate-CoA ligase